MTNAAAIGYAIMAAKVAGLDEKQINLLVATMEYDMDLFPEEKAEKEYRNS